MQSHLEQKELDAIRYNTDGRCFRLKIEGEILSLDVISQLNFWPEMKRLLPPLLPLHFLIYFVSPYLPSEIWIQVVLLFGFMQLLAFFWSRILKENIGFLGTKWVFDHFTNSLKIDKNVAARLSDIAGVIAWPKGKYRFLLALDLKDGKRIYIGDWCFSTKEFSWREDAQIIANFLKVPLYIPEV